MRGKLPELIRQVLSSSKKPMKLRDIDHGSREEQLLELAALGFSGLLSRELAALTQELKASAADPSGWELRVAKKSVDNFWPDFCKAK